MTRRYNIDSGTLIYISILLIGVFLIISVGYYKSTSTPAPLVVEYRLEIINQDSVKIQSVETGRMYATHIDSIQAVLEQDNL